MCCVCVDAGGRVGDPASRPGDPDPGAPPAAGLQHPTVPEGAGGAPLPAHLPGPTGEMHSGRRSSLYIVYTEVGTMSSKSSAFIWRLYDCVSI